MKDERYNELKKANNSLANELSDSYKKTAWIYIKKARGFASDTIDTEIKIQEVLNLLIDYDQRMVPYNIAIPLETEFVESNIKLLSSKVKDPNKIKSIIAVSIFIFFILLWVVLNYFIKKPSALKTPTNLNYELVEDNKIKIVWDEVDFATEGYIVWCINSEGQKQGNFETLEPSYTFIITSDKSYVFYVQARKTEYLENSKIASMRYPQ